MKEYNTELQEKLVNYMKETGVTNKEMAQKLGMSDSARLISWKNSNYEKGNIEIIEKAVAEFFRLSDAQQELERQSLNYKLQSGYVPTSLSELAYKTIAYCHKKHTFTIVYGDAGTGKTSAANKYCTDFPNSTIMFEADQIINTPMGVMRLIGDKLGVAYRSDRIKYLEEVKRRLDTGGKIIIIDEAQRLSYRAIEQIRNLPERNELLGRNGVGVCLIGNEEVLTRMNKGDPSRYMQQRQRIQVPAEMRLDAVKKSDIEKLFPYYAEQGMQKEIDFLFALAKGPRGIRTSVETYNAAVDARNVTLDYLIALEAQNQGSV